MRKWAYWTGHIETEDLQSTLANMGEQGWELCSIERKVMGGYTRTYGDNYCVFKRPGDVLERF